MTKRPFAAVAIAFANGQDIQYKNFFAIDNKGWLDWPHSWYPSFRENGAYDYRIKPQKVWRWVVKHDGVLAVSGEYYSSAKELETVHPHLTALQPVLSTEKEM